MPDVAQASKHVPVPVPKAAPAPMTTRSRVVAADQTSAWHPWLSALIVTVSSMIAGWTIGWVAIQVSQDAAPKWLLARVSGIASLVLLTGLVLLGLMLAHPRGTALRSLPRATMLRIHVALASFTAMFIVLHVVVLALDSYAGVGWKGALLPLGAEYRPLPVTLGWLGLYAGLVAGITARFAGRIGRIWWPLHHTTLAIYAAVWAHGVLAGTDSAALTFFYVGSGFLVIATAISRYTTDPIRSSHGGARP